MAFFNSAVDVLQTLVVALGAGCGIWGIINLMEGYSNDNPARMLMYGKEASNRKQEIDRQYHTIPNQRNKRQHSNYEKMSKTLLFSSVTTNLFPFLTRERRNKIQKFRFSHNADDGIPFHSNINSRRFGNGIYL